MTERVVPPTIDFPAFKAAIEGLGIPADEMLQSLSVDYKGITVTYDRGNVFGDNLARETYDIPFHHPKHGAS